MVTHLYFIAFGNYFYRQRRKNKTAKLSVSQGFLVRVILKVAELWTERRRAPHMRGDEAAQGTEAGNKKILRIQ
jgi:hypothetical protein